MFLNDRVVDTFLYLLTASAPGQPPAIGRPRTEVYNSFFHQKLFAIPQPLTLNTYGRGIPRRARGYIFDSDLVFVPILVQKHWFLGVVDFRCKRLRLYDSYTKRTPSHRFFSSMRSYMTTQHRLRGLGGEEFDWAGWEDEVMDCPQQLNSCDCGVFMLAVAAHLYAGAPVTFTQQDVTAGGFRQRIFLDLYYRSMRYALLMPQAPPGQPGAF